MFVYMNEWKRLMVEMQHTTPARKVSLAKVKNIKLSGWCAMTGLPLFAKLFDSRGCWLIYEQHIHVEHLLRAAFKCREGLQLMGRLGFSIDVVDVPTHSRYKAQRIRLYWKLHLLKQRKEINWQMDHVLTVNSHLYNRSLTFLSFNFFHQFFPQVSCIAYISLVSLKCHLYNAILKIFKNKICFKTWISFEERLENVRDSAFECFTGW